VSGRAHLSVFRASLRRAFNIGLLLLCVTACSADPVAVPRPNLNDVERPLCREFIAKLPDQLAGFESREVAPPSGLAAVWGYPPVIVTCGGLMPPEFNETSACEEIAGIGWFIPEEQLKDPSLDARVTTIGIKPLATVLIPAQHRGDAAGILSDIAPAIEQVLFLSDPCV
jgi:hypothetical protein